MLLVGADDAGQMGKTIQYTVDVKHLVGAMITYRVDLGAGSGAQRGSTGTSPA